MKKHLFLILSIIGIILPYSQFVLFTNQYGFDLKLMLEQIFINRMSSGIALDAMWAAVVLIFFIVSENKNLKIKHLWAPIVGIFMIGLSFAFPFYLYLREIALATQKKDASVDASL
jgi:hypothetical protein